MLRAALHPAGRLTVPLPAGTHCVLLDIEGTTTPVAFVYETLFPFARRRLDDSCARAAADPRIADAVRMLAEEHEQETGQGQSDLPPCGNGAPYAHSWNGVGTD